MAGRLGATPREIVPVRRGRMTPFHIALHARPAGDWPQRSLSIDGRPLTQLVVSPEQLHTPLALSFEEASQQLHDLPRLFLEPDGSFVWVSEAIVGGRWQVDGELFDRGGRLQYVTLRGLCPARSFDELISIFRPAGPGLLVQLLHYAVFVTEDDFRRFQFAG